MKKLISIMTATGICCLLLVSNPICTAAQDGSATQERADSDVEDDKDYGWIGLIGLAGLLGLRKRENNNKDYSARTTTNPRV